MGNDTLHRVARIRQLDDNTVEIHVQTDSFKPGREVEVSGYLTQGSSGAYAAFNVRKHIPLDANPTAILHVQLPAMYLDPDQDVSVVAQVAEVWPTFLGKEMNPEYVGTGLKAAWTPKDLWGNGSGGPAPSPPGNAGSGTTTNPPT